MDRFEELLSDYRDGTLDSDRRAELAIWIELVPVCREAFIEVVSDLRIRRLALERG